MPFGDIVPSHFPELYQSEWILQHQQMVDHVRSYMPVYSVEGDVRKFHRLNAFSSAEVDVRPTGTAPDRITTTNMGDTEIVNLFTSFYEADPAEVDKREAIRLGSISSPHESIQKSQYAALNRRMATVAVDGVLADRRLGKTGATTDAIPSGNVLDASATGLDYAAIDDIYTQLGSNQVLGQNIDGENTWTIFCRHKDLKVLRNDATLTNRDFSDIRPIDKGTIYSFRGGYIVALADAIFANQVAGQSGNPSGTAGTTRLPMFARQSVAFGDTESPVASVDVIPEWRNNVLLQLEAGFGATALDWEGVFGIEVPS